MRGTVRVSLLYYLLILISRVEESADILAIAIIAHF